MVTVLKIEPEFVTILRRNMEDYIARETQARLSAAALSSALVQSIFIMRLIFQKYGHQLLLHASELLKPLT